MEKIRVEDLTCSLMIRKQMRLEHVSFSIEGSYTTLSDITEAVSQRLLSC